MTGVLDSASEAHRPAIRGAGRKRWAEVPALSESAPWSMPGWAIQTLAVLVALAGPVVRAQASPFNRVQVVLAVGVAASVAIALIPERRWWARLALVIVAAVVLERAEGPLLGLWLGVGLGLADWGIRRRRPLPFVPTPGPTGAIPIVVLVLIATHGARDTQTGAAPLRFLVLAVLLTLIGSVTGDWLPQLIGRLGRAAALAVGRGSFGLLAIPVVIVPWLAHRLVGVDPLASHAPDGTAWQPRSRLDLAPTHPWTAEPLLARPTWWYRLRRVTALPALVALVAGSIALARQGAPDLWTDPGSGMESASEIPAAYEDAEWYPGYVRDIEWIISNNSGVWRPLRTKRVRDVRTDSVNVRNGVRATWAPPPCGCRRLTVWMYGGSTTFGLGQRDDHTIASELSRAAWADGIALDVVNRGIPGHMHWTEANHLAWDLTIEDKPDLVVFYDGVNELWGVSKVRDERDRDEPIEPLSDDLWDGIVGGAEEPSPPQGGELLEALELPPRSDAESGALAVELYDRSRKMALDLGEANDLPVRFFWQPSRLSRPPHPEEPRVQGVDREEGLRAFYGAAEAAVPKDVGDLTEALKSSDGPLFSDDVHHNEEGARLIATAMYGQLRGEVLRLEATGGGS